MVAMINHLHVAPVVCPHCGNMIAVCVDANTNGTQHILARCDDAQDGGCNKPFAVSYTVRVNAVATALHDDIDLD